MRDEFRPGPLSARQASLLNDLLRFREQFERISFAPPLFLTRKGGIPVVTAAGGLGGGAVLAAITGHSGAVPPVHTARQKTAAADGSPADAAPAVDYDRVLYPLNDYPLETGTLVALVDAADGRGSSWAFPLQVAFPVELASAWSDATGYDWTLLARTGQTLAPPGAAITGNAAMTPNRNTALPAGTRGWNEPDPTGTGFVFLPDPPFAPPRRAASGGSGGSGTPGSGPTDDGYPSRVFPGDYRDPVAVRDVVCVKGTQYVTRGRQQVVDDGARLRTDWYDLKVTPEGCCACSGSGSGSGSPAAAGCCPNGHDPTVDVVLTGPFAADCGPLDLAGTATYDDATGAWVGTATGGSVSAVVVLSCDGVGTWHLYALVTLADGAQAVAEGHLDTEGETLVGTPELSDGTGCTDAALSVVVGNPCVTAPACVCRGQAACTGAGVAERYTFTLEGATGEFAGANGDWEVVQVNLHPEIDGCAWRGTKGDWAAALGFITPTTPQLFLGDGGASLTYLGTGGPCCTGLTSWVLDAFVGAGNKPTIGGSHNLEPADCGSCSGVTTTCCGATTVPQVLYAHFTGALAGFGTVTLTYTGAQWEGEANNGAGCQTNVQFRCGTTGFSVTMGGPGTVGSVAETAATTCDPFSWTGSGTASVNCAGAFGMTVDTTP